MPNNKIYIFSYREMELIAEAYYYHYFDEHFDPIRKEIVALGKKIEAIPEDWVQHPLELPE